MNILPRPILDEIFNLQFQISDIAIQHFVDELDDLGFVVTNYINHDAAVMLNFSGEGMVGELRIDRIRRCFDIIVKCEGAVVLPASGDWNLVVEYLQKVTGRL